MERALEVLASVEKHATTDAVETRRWHERNQEKPGAFHFIVGHLF
jgi:hypothetical protein